MRNLLSFCFFSLISGGAICSSAEPEPPWRLGEALGVPDWLEISGQQRSRYETLGGQFRAGKEGGDQAIALRTSLLAQLKSEPGRLVVEVLDARHYGSDEGSPIDTTMVNAMDVLQCHVRVDAGHLIPGGTNTIRLGRETLDLGNRRLMARNAFRNTINAFTGADWLWQADRGGSVRAFYFLPVRRLPESTDALLDNDIVADTQSFNQQFYGVYLEAPPWKWDIRAEVYYFQLQEEASPDLRGRHLQTPGLRLYRNATPGQWDFEIESTYQFGTSRLRSGSTAPELDHQAHHHHGAIGYTVQAVWSPRAGLRYDFASGDSDPNNLKNGRFDTLFGARRFDFGPTGIYGAIPRSNLSSPEYNVSIRPLRSLEISISHRWLWLAESRDAWTSAGVRDPSGASGTDVGQQVEWRVRWDVLPGNLRLDTGYTHLFAGKFLDSAPNSSHRGDVNYGYFEVTWMF